MVMETVNVNSNFPDVNIKEIKYNNSAISAKKIPKYNFIIPLS